MLGFSSWELSLLGMHENSVELLFLGYQASTPGSRSGFVLRFLFPSLPLPLSLFFFLDSVIQLLP